MPDNPLSVILLNLVVFVAAIFQTVTGIGFALIAGPILLVVLDNTSAVQASIILNLFMSVALAPLLIRHRSDRHLGELAAGSIVGLPFGAALFVWANLTMLKLGAGLLIGVTVLLSLWRPKGNALKTSTWAGVATGIVSGAMTGFAAMPGPAASLYLTSFHGLQRDTVRSTIFLLFVVSYAGALAIHWLLTGLQPVGVNAALALTPMTIAGMIAGYFLAPRVSQKRFKTAVTAVLILTVTTLLASTLR